MRKVYLLLLGLSMVGTQWMAAQTTASRIPYLRGKVYHATTSRPLPGVSLKISNGHSTITDREGYFALDLSVGDKTPGSELTIYLMDAALGNDVATVTVPSNLNKDVRLEFHSDRYQIVSGTVVDQTTQALLPGISVRVMPDIQGLNIEPPAAVITDALGWFVIHLDKETYGTVTHVQMIVHDGSRKYQDWIGLEQARGGVKIGLVGGEQSSSAAVTQPNPTHGILCLHNKSQQMKEINVHKCGPNDNCFTCEQGVTVSTTLEAGERSCFEEIPRGKYLVYIGSLPYATEKYTVQIIGGKTSTTEIK